LTGRLLKEWDHKKHWSKHWTKFEIKVNVLSCWELIMIATITLFIAFHEFCFLVNSIFCCILIFTQISASVLSENFDSKSRIGAIHLIYFSIFFWKDFQLNTYNASNLLFWCDQNKLTFWKKSQICCVLIRVYFKNSLFW
jgi:hypothetical protein